MNKIIGPISKAQWKTLRGLRASIKQYKELNDASYQGALEQDKELYDYYLTKVCA